jgi:hypothetical protein
MTFTDAKVRNAQPRDAAYRLAWRRCQFLFAFGALKSLHNGVQRSQCP